MAIVNLGNFPIFPNRKEGYRDTGQIPRPFGTGQIGWPGCLNLQPINFIGLN